MAENNIGDSSAVPNAGLENLRVFVVEDEALVAMMLEEMLRDFGCTVVGPIDSIGAALDAVEQQAADVAILDVNVQGESIYPVADLLHSRNIPLIFATGYGKGALKPEYQNHLTLAKPYDTEDVRQRLFAAMRARKT
jgi:CheY-like chemotaxis protein